MTAKDLVTVHIENVPRSSITHVLIAIELADAHWDSEQHQAVTALVLGLRAAQDEALNDEQAKIMERFLADVDDQP